MKAGRSLLVIFGAALASGAVAAQTVTPDAKEPTVMMVQGPGGGGPPMGPGGPEGPGPAPFAERIELLGFGGMRGGKVVTGSPFSAVAVSENTQTLPDGNKIDHRTETNMYRDSQGRFRREIKMMGIGPLAAAGQPRSFVVIQDPVSNKSYVLEDDKKIARSLPGPGKEGHGPRDEVRFERSNGPNQGNVQKEDLGTQTINGVSAQGTRYTTTIPAGQIGNEKPIVITNETWYSPDLQMLIMSKRSDPRFGTTVYQLTNIQRTEPPSSLFTVPAGYSIETRPHGGRGLRRGGDMPPPPDAVPPGM